jgi:YHS domain-containing protein
MEIDPVCGMEVDSSDAQWTAQFEDATYYFCSPGCKAEFENNPGHYVPEEE